MANWMVRREIDNRFLCVDNCWRHYVAGVENIKIYKSAVWAERSLRVYGAPYVETGYTKTRGTVYAIHPGDTIDRNGKITKG